jgi:hypothetical protein
MDRGVVRQIVGWFGMNALLVVLVIPAYGDKGPEGNMEPYECERARLADQVGTPVRQDTVGTSDDSVFRATERH